MAGRNIEVLEIETDGGSIDISDLQVKLDDKTAGVIVQSPNFFGIIEDQEQIFRDCTWEQCPFYFMCGRGDVTGMFKKPGRVWCGYLCR